MDEGHPTEHIPIEETKVLKLYVDIANRIWRIVKQWRPFEQDTMGKQIVRAADSVGANLVEGDGRYHSGDSIQFFVIARGLARETRYWVRLSIDRELITLEEGSRIILDIRDATRQLNELIRYRRSARHSQVREDSAPYRTDATDPFAEHFESEEPTSKHFPSRYSTPNT